jgi:hypothetical protein
MSKQFSKWILALASTVMLLNSGVALADTYTFSLLPPDGNLMGPAGSTIGWGYSITNDSTTDWLVTDALNADIVQHAILDLSYFDLPIVAPTSTVSEVFDIAPVTGLAALTWDVGAPLGFTNAGNFVLSAEWWNGDPLSGGSFIQDALDETAAYSATVGAPSVTPEPAAVTPLLIALVCLCVLRHRDKSRRKTVRTG